jgi:hypothetical protein
MIPIVVGNDAAHTPSRFNVDSLIPLATIMGGAHYHHINHTVTCQRCARVKTTYSYENTSKQAVRPGSKN